MTSFVDLDTGRPGWLLGLAPGRSGALVQTWLSAPDQAWRDQVEVVALDPSAPFAAAVHRRGRPLASGPAGQPDGHRRAPAGGPRAAGPPRPQDRPGLGAPAA